MVSDDEERLYWAIDRLMTSGRNQRRLARFRIDAGDAVHDIWIRLIPYCRKKSIREIEAYVGHYGPRLLHRVIDKSEKHKHNRDHREIV